MPAIDRYDGPAFRVLHRYLREEEDRQLKVYILSAEFGLISSNNPIPYYDRRMTAARALELREGTTPILESLLRQHACSELFLCASKIYQQAIDQSTLMRLLPVRYAASGQGPKLASLHRWLREKSNG